MHIFQQDFYRRSVRQVARDLLGQRLVSTVDGRLTSGQIVETEAYLHAGDSACHAARGPTPGNSSMFGPGGRSYVYSIHARWCFNVVTQNEGEGCAVLIRALRPLTGVATMMTRRQNGRPRDLCRGPARLSAALGIDKQLDGHDLTVGQRLWIDSYDALRIVDGQIRVTPRIGVTSAETLSLRYVIADNRYASGPAHLRCRQTNNH